MPGRSADNGFPLRCCAALLMAAACRWTPAQSIQPFDFHGVTLQPGLLRSQLDDARAYYLAIPNDDLLKGFRQRAGKRAPGEDLGGWYTDDVFHVFGQIVSGLCRMYGAAGDKACKQKAEALFKGWAECLAPDGYFYYSIKPNAPHYIFDKTVGALVDLAIYCGSKDALVALERITDWAIRNLDRKRPFGADSSEWYTLSENLLRAYQLTGNPKYREFAKVWEYTDYWNAYAQDKSIFELRGSYHAYSHLNALGGAAIAYEVTGQSRYIEAARNGYDFFQSNQCFATGGFGPNETLMPRDQLLRTYGDTANTYETQCGSWAIFKLCRRLMASTGEARFGDWIEKAVYNGVAATIPMTQDGRVFYYSDYSPYGGYKQNIDFGWSCCTGTRPIAAAEIANLIYFHDTEGIQVNLFLPSTLKTSVHGSAVTLVQHTKFPEEPRTRFSVRLPGAKEFTLSIRKPNWLAGQMRPKVNGVPLRFEEEGGWCRLKRTWSDRDIVTVDLPMALRSVPLGRESFPTAIAYGPVVLAFRSKHGNPGGNVNVGNLALSRFQTPLTWSVSSDPTVTAQPFYAYKAGEEYFLYLDPAAVNRVPFHKLKFTGQWSFGGSFLYSNQVGATCEGTFEGSGVNLIGWEFDDAGRAEVRVDDKVVGVADQYGPGRGLAFEWKLMGLARGKHTIKVTVLEAKDPSSKDRYINIGGLQILP